MGELLNRKLLLLEIHTSVAQIIFIGGLQKKFLDDITLAKTLKFSV